MKSLILLLSSIMSLTALADETVDASVQLTPQQAQQVESTAYSNKVIRYQHNQARLALARQSNQNLATPGMPLQRPYYGDLAGASSMHSH